uniref:Odorant receptor n=1 Tax=Dendrolimus kikuchii TaxID=765133 RepID=A0A076EDH2_9NEOP|nr:odorant receptor [Dendrolimus kikuchii]
MAIEFDTMFNTLNLALKLSLFHPQEKITLKWILKFLIVYGFYTLIFLNMIYYNIYADLKNRKFIRTCHNALLATIYMAMSFKYCIITWKGKIIIKLINMMKEDFQTADTLIEEKVIVEDFAKRGRRIPMQLVVYTAYTLLVFLFKHFCLEIYYFVIGDFQILPPYDITYPSFIEDVKFKFIPYVLLYFVIIYYMVYSSIGLVAFESLGPIFIVHACGQLELAKRNISSLFIDTDEEAIARRMKIFIQRMQRVYIFVDDVNETFRLSYEVVLKGIMIVLPLAGYAVIRSFRNGAVNVEFLSLIIGGIALSAVPCYFSDLLKQKSEEVRQAIYACGWESQNTLSQRSSLLIALTRALRPVVIKTTFSTLCLETLSDVNITLSV